MAIRSRMLLIDWLLLAGLSVLWGGSFLFNKVALGAFPPFTLVALRIVLAALVLALAIRVTRTAWPSGASLWRTLLLMGVVGNVLPFSLIVWGQTQIASALASILNATTPLFTLLVAQAFIADERMNRAKALGVVVGFAGVVVMIAPSLDAFDGPLLAKLACLGAALSYGFSGVVGRRLGTFGAAPLQLAFGQLAASSVLVIPLALIADRPWTLPAPGAVPLGALIALAVFSTAFAYLIFFRLLARAGATNTSLVTFLVPITAILFGVGLLGESLTLEQVAGMVLILVGLAIIDGRIADMIGLRRPEAQIPPPPPHRPGV